ncbi:HIT domain-containing protein [Alteromonas sp. C1M14]|uniref:HIT domain-containing protein n=1 Tax=Alteromonas sp. C1M14 TaxID=2841567 RepID=UPI001C09043B|nr:HIT domain-containing protein [Alteromonas sp. C1M14]MBU2978897.1 HIT domain-containing protein [Alteromonas sp. C1M14]
MFSLDPRLQNDCVLVQDLDLCRVLLANDSQFPWLILVPRIKDAVELTDLNSQQMVTYWAESSLTCDVLTRVFEPHKLNVAAIGNIVRQLHIHHVARFENDVAWPAPIWGKQPAVPYTKDALETRLTTIRNAFLVQEKS